MKFILLLLTYFYCTNSQATFDLVFKEKDNRYLSVWLGVEFNDVYNGDKDRKNNILVSPMPKLTRFRGLIDLCSNNSYNSLIQPLPYQLNMCENYFCSNSTPHYLQEGNYSLQRHIDLHRYCYQCNVTSDQKFHLVLQNKTCNNFDRTICTNNTCGNNADCIIYDWRGNICYVPEQKIYYRFNDFTHNYTYWIYFRYLGYFDLALYLCLYVIYTLLDVVPELVYLFQTIEKDNSFGKKVLHFFGLKSQSIYWIWISLSLMIVMALLDTIEFLRLKLILIGDVFSIGIFYISYFNLLIKWTHILNQSSDEVNDTLPLKYIIILFIFYFLFFMVGVVGLIIITGHVFIARSESSPWMPVAGSYVAILLIVSIIFGVVLTIFSFRMIYILSRDQVEFSKNIFKLNFSKIVFWMNISALPLIFAMFLSSILFLFGRDVFSIQLWLYYNRILNYSIVFCFIGFIIAFLKLENLKTTYFSCIINKEE